MDRVEARQLVDQIRAGLDDLRDAVIALWQGAGWLALGYPTWDDLCDAELRMRVQLPREERREVVTQLTDAGMSTRAIGSALGVDQAQVIRDKQQVMRDASPSPEPAPEPAKVIGLDGKVYAPPSPEEIERRRQVARDAAEREEFRRRQRVATHLLCEHVVAIAQTQGQDVPSYYNPSDAIPGRAVTRQVIADARAALDAIDEQWKERGLP